MISKTERGRRCSTRMSVVLVTMFAVPLGASDDEASMTPFVSRLELDAETSHPLLGNLNYFSQNLPEFIDNVIGPLAPGETAYYYNAKAPMARLPGISFVPRYTWQDRELRNIITRPGSSEEPSGSAFPLYYCSIPLDHLPRRVFGDINNLGFPGGAMMPVTKGGLWITSPGVVAALHFDSSANYLHQLVGTKRVLLINPRQWRSLYLYSALHPLARQSQVPFENGPRAIADAGDFPGALDTVLEEHVLEPGHSLFIPPFYFHMVHVPSLGQSSIGVNTYLDAPHKEILSNIYAIDVPRSSVSELLRLMVFLFSSGLSMNLPALALDMLNTRWSHIGRDRFLAGDLSAALGVGTPLELQSHDTTTLVEPLGKILNSSGGAVGDQLAFVTLFRELRELAPDAFEMLCADFIEVTTARALGAGSVRALLALLASGDAPAA